MAEEERRYLHASAIAYRGAGLLILGASGRGKSSLALQMMAQGAALVADDQVILTCKQGTLWAQCPATIAGRIEARGIGILRAEAHGPVALRLAIDLDQQEDARLPPWRSRAFLGVDLALVFPPRGAHLGPALLQYLAYGRSE